MDGPNKACCGLNQPGENSNTIKSHALCKSCIIPSVILPTAVGGSDKTGFGLLTDEDTLWKKHKREKQPHQVQRATDFLHTLFDNAEEQVGWACAIWMPEPCPCQPPLWSNRIRLLKHALHAVLAEVMFGPWKAIAVTDSCVL